MLKIILLLVALTLASCSYQPTYSAEERLTALQGHLEGIIARDSTIDAQMHAGTLPCDAAASLRSMDRIDLQFDLELSRHEHWPQF